MTPESSLAAIALAVALLPVVLLAGRAWAVPVRIAAGFGVLAACGAAGWAAGHYRPAPIRETQVANRPVEFLDEQYVTSRTCRGCHPHWHASYHRAMTQVASPQTVVAPFDGRTMTTRRLRSSRVRGVGLVSTSAAGPAHRRRDRAEVRPSGTTRRQWHPAGHGGMARRSHAGAHGGRDCRGDRVAWAGGVLAVCPCEDAWFPVRQEV